MAAHSGIKVPNLEAWRKARILTQSELAEASGVVRATIIRAEAGDPISVASVRKLAAALGITPEELVNSQPKKEAA